MSTTWTSSRSGAGIGRPSYSSTQNKNPKFASAEFGIVGEDAQDKVMELDGSDMGGRELHVKVTSGAVTAVHTRRYRSIPNKRACKVQRC
ncbi:hypothetical protein YC2023_026501 [Brassica napus]